MTEITLQTGEEWYRALGEAAPGFVWVTDLTGRVVYGNRPREEYTGSSVEQINAGGRAQFNHPDEAVAVAEKWPIAASTPDPESPRAPSPGARADEVVLVAEDEEMVRSIMARTLRDCGYVVLEAADGPEALRTVQESDRQISLIVADLVMPGLGGRELGARVAKIRPDIPILFTSGYTGMDVVRRGLLDEGREFLQKPLAPEALARKVRQMLDAKATRP